MGRCRLSTFVAAGVLLAAAGCADVPSTPSDHGWRVHGERNLGDVVSALSTTALVLREQSEGKLVANYARVTVAQAEESGGSAASKFTGEQPPQAEQERFSKISDALDTANGMLTDARIALLDDPQSACEKYCDRLLRMSSRVQKLEDGLKQPSSPKAAER